MPGPASYRARWLGLPTGGGACWRRAQLPPEAVAPRHRRLSPPEAAAEPKRTCGSGSAATTVHHGPRT